MRDRGNKLAARGREFNSEVFEMAEGERDVLAERLADDWEIKGYSTTIMAAGAMTHSILLQKRDLLDAVTIIITGEKELGRTHQVLSPRPEKKKGWLG